jgi:hypothetical protein
MSPLCGVRCQRARVILVFHRPRVCILSTVLGTKFRFVCATRASREKFFTDTALGRSLKLYRYNFVDLRLFPGNSASLSVVYNQALQEAVLDPAILLFVHDDVHLLDFFWPVHVLAALESFDVVGVAGNRRRMPHQAVWFLDANRVFDRDNLSGTVAHGRGFPPENLSFYGPSCQEVKLLDGLLLIARSQTLLAKQICFDERFDFHFYDLDFCRQAEAKGLKMGTWTLAVIHESAGELSPAWQAAYEKYLEKWQS